ncbi:MAG: HAMP domain-containing sensor histidine kinase [Candidatus Electryonea clarkiae]|nr:HAMP domain-containing sensor histidine kinase [Candidatus Electryonea clarkiae]MDP8287766.1 HAMP domain-containing sensor histidine kinase [Candidatus Electryonea clarkiae]
MALTVVGRKRLLISLIILLLVGLAMFHTIFIFGMSREAKSRGNANEATLQANISLINTMTNEVERIWRNHAIHLLEADSTSSPGLLSQENLNELAKLPHVLDAFSLDFKAEESRSVHGILPQNILFENFDKQDKKPLAGIVRMNYALIGGLTKLEDIKGPEQKRTLMIRYRGTFSPALGTEVIGLVLDRDWTIHHIPSLMDSVVRDDFSFHWLAPIIPREKWVVDTVPRWYKKWEEKGDPWLGVGGYWKQVIGIKHADSTLWRDGDPNAELFFYQGLFDKSGHPYMKWIPFDLEVSACTSFPQFWDTLDKGYRNRSIYFLSMEILGIALLGVLVLSLRQFRKQEKRNRIALSHLAHSIKTPITRIRLDVDSLLADFVGSEEEESDILQAVSHECERMELAVQGASYALNEGKLDLNTNQSDLRELVKETIEAWRPQFVNSKIKLNIEIPLSPLEISIDREKIAVLLDNLLDNALRHTMIQLPKLSEEADVTVRMSTSAETVQIIVDDRGEGIKSSDRKLVFERFQRTPGSAGTGTTGLGLGLALVKEIAKGHGGSVNIKDREGGGSSFIVSLPRTE